MKKILILSFLFLPFFSSAQVIGNVQITGNNPYTINASVNSEEFADPANYFCLVIDNEFSEQQFGTVVEPFNEGENSIIDSFEVNPESETLYVGFLPLDTNGPCEYQLYGDQGGQTFLAPFSSDNNGFLAQTIGVVTGATDNLQQALLLILAAVGVLALGLIAFYFGWGWLAEFLYLR